MHDQSVCKPQSSQCGVALISVLLVFALIAILAADMLALSYRDIKKTHNQIKSRQSHLYALGGEQLARQLLYRDYQQDPSTIAEEKSDNINDIWAVALDSFNINEGKMTLSIEDLQGRFNLNAVYDNQKKQVNNEYLAAYQQLEQQLGVKPNISAALIDWIDTNKTVMRNGGEDSAYTSKESPYLTANAPLFDSSELRLIDGMGFDAYQALRKHVSTLPNDAKINFNTATQKVLKAVAPRLSRAELSQIFKTQHSGGFTTLEEWFQQPYGGKIKDKEAFFSVFSEYFEVKIKSLYDGRLAQLSTTLYRNAEDGSIHVIKRKIDQ
jgi:general secretion pathway protein K